MMENRLRQLWKEDRPALGCWLSIPDSFSAEVIAHLGFDWLCIDMQHGLVDYQRALTMLQAISTTDAAPVVRVPWNDPGIIMKMLDAGACAVIVPMIETPADAEKAVAACRYPPAGARSFGPTRAMLAAGEDYFAKSGEYVCCIPMIETKPALDNLDDILSVPGVDAVYIGPMDLSLALGLPPKPDGDEPVYAEARQKVVDACRRHNVVAGIHSSAAAGPNRVAEGFRFVLVASDVTALTRGAAQDLAAVRRKLS
ncbi:MAG TPA: aldolase/citrate lyase family protein [Dehalococcoidia bacterium]|nr:aldolase/citrate lyase family protein [Dehalococcoidia bacterium]